MALGSGSTPSGGVWSSALHPHTLCACQQSSKPSVLGLDFRRPVRKLGRGGHRISGPAPVGRPWLGACWGVWTYTFKERKRLEKAGERGREGEEERERISVCSELEASPVCSAPPQLPPPVAEGGQDPSLETL